MKIIVLFFLILPGFLWAQTKFEREYRLDKEDVPVQARSFIDSCAFTKKVRWYEEESLTGRSLEAKAKKDDRRYSIEFDTLGQIEDVEVLADWEALPQKPRDEICLVLSERYRKFRLKRIQLQWTGEPEALIELVRAGKTEAPYTVKYEIVVRGKNEEGVEWNEYLFSQSGEIERVSPIIFRNTDNLDY